MKEANEVRNKIHDPSIVAPFSEQDLNLFRIAHAVTYKLLIATKDGFGETISTYLFSWDEIPGNDNERLIEFLKKRFGIEWAENAKIEKIDNGRIIRLSFGNNFLSLKLNDDKTVVSLKIDDSRTDEFITKMENGKLNIYISTNFKAEAEKLAKECLLKLN